MSIQFSKMHGLGNDFMVLDRIRQQFDLTPERLRQWGDRNTGVGFDQLLLVEAPHDPANDFRYRIFNRDGLEVQQCGNGARCFARFVRDQGLSDKAILRVETARGVIFPEILSNGMVRVNMGLPQFSPESLPFLTEVPENEHLSYLIDYQGKSIHFGIVSMGNPHAVHRVESLDDAPVASLGAYLERHAQFPEGVNVGFMQVIDSKEIYLRVFERGVGETLACGTGACAAAVYGMRRNWLECDVTVHMRGGALRIEWAGEGEAVFMTGEAITVFKGEIE